MDNKLAVCRIRTNFENFNMVIDKFIEKIPLKIENYKNVKIINSFITDNLFNFDIEYSCSDQDVKDIFENIMKEIVNSPSRFIVELEPIN
ncbi:hypothetical protein [Clostridium sp. HV4-5-A1G]|uniref:hypothetical protein n=1 Tax=Clostridium sp. HV4-5-A1G TaxID=2004595 RepID=UPI00123BF0BC|nr:hypothetical protein [Clostridium sp. HV4-5-A1G]KAA8674637.1 hypothetical protein F3O63_06925 [Clostridium sp. HV4-5-A1G]